MVNSLQISLLNILLYSKIYSNVKQEGAGMKMEKKKVRLGKAFSFTLEFVLKFPLFILLPVFVLLIIFYAQQYLIHTLPILKYLSPGEIVANRIHHFTKPFIIRNLVDCIYRFIAFFLDFILLSGYIRIVKKWLKEKVKPEWKDFFTWDFRLFGKYFVLEIILVVISCIGFILLIVPGFIIVTTYLFSAYVLLDKNCEIQTAFDKSAELTKSIKWLIFGVILLFILFNYPGVWTVYSYWMMKQSIFSPFSILISFLVTFLKHIYQFALVYLYVDLSTQQDVIDKQISNKEEVHE